jgi:hypothetical protein
MVSLQDSHCQEAMLSTSSRALTGAFGTAALDLYHAGLVVVPTAGADGKTPCLKGWNKLRRQSLATITRLAMKFRDANIGVLTGASGLTVVDCDDEATLREAEARFGETPLVIRTPRGGGHLYFRSAGERSANLRPALNIDIRGIGGMVLVPPSIREAYGAYRFERGSWSALVGLPTIAPGALPGAHGVRGTEAAAEGARNDTLFKSMRLHALECDSRIELSIAAHSLNASFTPPLGANEVERVVKSIWRMKEEGRLFLPGAQRIVMDRNELSLVSADGFALLAFIRSRHGAREHLPFVLCAKAMEESKCLKGWGRRRLRNAINELVESRLLLRTHRGGQHPGDPHVYQMAS